jgi:hypothetical protein
MICVSIKDLHSLSFRQKVAGYSEATHHKIGLTNMMVTKKMIKLGFFLFTINHNSKLNKQTRRYRTLTFA